MPECWDGVSGREECVVEGCTLYLSVVVVVNYCFLIWRQLRQNKCLTLFCKLMMFFPATSKYYISYISLKKKI